MKIQDIKPLPHVQGYIQVKPGPGGDEHGSPGFEVVLPVHAQSQQSMEGGAPSYIVHPLKSDVATRTGELREIPIRLLFDRPEHNITARYESWSNAHESSPICIGDGETAKRFNPEDSSFSAISCPGPQFCPHAKGLDKCSIQVRMPVQIEEQDSVVSVFEMRSNSMNTYTSLKGSLDYLFARVGALRNLELKLVAWEKSTRGSNYKAFTCASIDLARPIPFEKLREMAPVLDEALDAYAASRVESYYSEISVNDQQIEMARRSGVENKRIRTTSSQETVGNQATTEKVSAVFAEAITAVKARGNTNEPSTA
jgi:hypothetical protein